MDHRRDRYAIEPRANRCLHGVRRSQLPLELVTHRPWDPNHQHAGPPIALVCRAIEQAVHEHGLTDIARLTANLLRPVPISNVIVEVITDYVGRNAGHFSAHLLAGDKEVARFAAFAPRESPARLSAGFPGHPFANAVAGFSGKDAGDGLLKLLAGHWGAVKALTDSAKSKSVAGEDKAMNDLGMNAGAIAKFLAGANPNWKESDLDSALLMHGGDHRKQVDLMMSRAPKSEQGAAWTEMQHHMDTIADALADGIAKQFPDKAN